MRGSPGATPICCSRAASAARKRSRSSAMASASDQGNELQESRFTDRRDDERRIEIVHLHAVEQDDHAVLAHCLERDLDLSLGIEPAFRTAFAVELALLLRRRDEADEAPPGRVAVVALDL